MEILPPAEISFHFHWLLFWSSLSLETANWSNFLAFLKFLSAVTLVAVDYGFTCPPRFMFVVCHVLGWTKVTISQPCALRSPIELKLGGDLGLVSQTSVHVFDSRFDYFLYCKQTKERTKQNRENWGVTKLAFSPPFPVRLIWNLVGTFGQVLGIVWYVCFVYIIVCLHFGNVNKENTLYGSFGRLRVKSFETWWMSSPKPNTQSWVFCLLIWSFVYVLWI
jgi:hypothetical protein